MIFDDSLEYDGFFPANGAELISMKKWFDIKLSEIWIPAELLPNRDLPLRLNADKPVLYHTLEKPKPPVDSLSVYSELNQAIQEIHCNSEKLLDSLEDLPYDRRWEEYGAATLPDEDFQSNFYEGSDFNEQEIFKSGENSFADLLEHLCLSDSDAEDQTVESKPAFDPSPKDCEKQLANHLNDELSNSGDQSADSAKSINSNSESIEKSDVLCSDSNDKDFSKELALNSDEFSKIPVSDEVIKEVKHISNVFGNSDSNNLGENLLNPNVEIISKSDSICDSSPQKPVFFYQNPSKDILGESAKKEKPTDCKQTADDKLIFAAENEDCLAQADPFIPYPILYTVSKKEEVVSDGACASRRKVKKDKKPKKKTSKNIDLCNFFISASETKNKQSDVPDYLNYLMQKEWGNASPVKSSCDVSSSPDTVFPSLPEKSEDFGLFGKIEEDEIEDMKMSLKIVTDLLKESARPTATDETVPVDVPDNGNIIKIVIENIPLGVDNETVESILHNYGTIIRLTLRRQGVFLKADVQMCLHPHIEDAEWIIECLNGSQPFGVSSSGEELKCYLRK